MKADHSFALHFLWSKFNKEDAIINVIGRVPNAANELSAKQQLPTATPAITAVNWINVILVYFKGDCVCKWLQRVSRGISRCLRRVSLSLVRKRINLGNLGHSVCDYACVLCCTNWGAGEGCVVAVLLPGAVETQHKILEEGMTAVEDWETDYVDSLIHQIIQS